LLEEPEAEKAGLALYKKLLELTRDRSVMLEEYARRIFSDDVLHLGEVIKMLRNPGEVKAFSSE
jgi:bacterioferritin